MHEVWIVAEICEGKLKDVSFELLARGRVLADALGVRLGSIVMGHKVEKAELEKLVRHGSDVIYASDDIRLASFGCERYSNVLVHLITAHKPQIVIAGATSMGRTLMPYVAVKTHAGLTADCTELAIEEGSGNLLQTRPAIGGISWQLSRQPTIVPRWRRSGPGRCVR